MSDSDSSSPPLLRPLPRRPFDISSSSQASDSPSSQPSQPQGLSPEDSSSLPPRTRSILNLTSSTLFGIYAPTTSNDADGTHTPASFSEPATPWGTGAETPARRKSSIDLSHDDDAQLAFYEEKAAAIRRRRRSTLTRKGSVGGKGKGHEWRGLVWRVGVLFAFGVAYGVIISHLHENASIVPVRVEGVRAVEMRSWGALMFWGIAGVGLGMGMAVVDELWQGTAAEMGVMEEVEELGRRGEMARGWESVVRSVGAFVGIAFAIRKLPWQSTLQASLTLALVNPALWYLLDRTLQGITLSSLVGFLGTGALLLINPSIVPSPASLEAYNRTSNHTNGYKAESGSRTLADEDLFVCGLSYDSVGISVWIGSVLFCSCVCFGNIGRRLALLEGWRSRR